MTGLDGRRALVVAAGSGIGRAVADAFLTEGARVAVLEKDAAKCQALREDLPNVSVVTGDATESTSAYYVFLASDRARGITGDVVHPDGGIAVRR